MWEALSIICELFEAIARDIASSYRYPIDEYQGVVNDSQPIKKNLPVDLERLRLF